MPLPKAKVSAVTDPRPRFARGSSVACEAIFVASTVIKELLPPAATEVIVGTWEVPT